MFHEKSLDQISSIIIIYHNTTIDQGWYTYLASNSAVTYLNKSVTIWYVIVTLLNHHFLRVATI